VRARGGRGRFLLPTLAAVLLAGVLASAGGSSPPPRFILVFRLAPPHATVARALAIARSLDLDGPAVRDSPSSYVVSDRAGERTLVLFKASGGFDYVNRAAYGQAPAGQLPTAEQARRLAIQFLRIHRLLPAGDARVEVHPDSRSAATSLVVAVIQLAAGAPVLDGAITFWLGGGGAIERLRDEHRPLAAAAARVTSRPRSAVLKEIQDDLGPMSGLRLRLAYVAQPPYLPQPYLEPVYEAVSHGVVVDRARATTFTPRAVILAPKAGVPIVAGSTVHLRARGTEGRRPYRFRWYANASGFLGRGKALDVPLRAGDTEVQLTVRDSSGAGLSYELPVQVAGAKPEAPAVPARAQQAGGAYGDGTISFEAGQDAVHPLVFHDVQAGGLRRASAVYFDQFRYSVLVRFQGSEYHVTSRKCVPLTAPGDACALPRSPFAQSSAATGPEAGGNDSWVDSTLTVDGLPGRLRLVVEGSAQPAYCGPAGELGAIALELLPKFVFGTGTSLGADCPGFRPSVEWSYRPPAVFRTSDLARLCLQGTDLCDVPQAHLALWLTGALDAGPQPEIADFRLSVYTAIDPGGSDPGRAALARDSDGLLAPAATDGPVDSSCRPSPCISPIATERSALLAASNGRGDWDGVSLKSESPAPSGIAFPGCNRPLDGYDIPGCIHLREHWPGGAETRSHGQEVTVFVIRRRPGDGSPASVEGLVDGEPLRQDAEHGYDLVLWHRSSASSTQCYPSGGVDNTDRPCRVFPQALFFTPR
jgi:hypothetical protein